MKCTLNLNKFFEMINHLPYVCIKVDVPYVPQDFPTSYAVGKDIDIIANREDIMHMYHITEKFSKDYTKQYEIVWHREVFGFRVRFETKGKLHFQIDVAYQMKGKLPEEFYKKCVTERISCDDYYITTPNNEVEIRKLCVHRNKPYHQLYIDEHSSK